MTTPGRRRLDALRWAARAARVRLRFALVLATALLVVGKWDAIRARWDRLAAPTARDPALGAVSADTEYFCPMDPGVLSDWPAKCAVCNMALVRRARGEMGPMPDGVVARVQLAPNRVQLAGIRTAAVAYRPLERELVLVGRVVRDGAGLAVAAEADAAGRSSIRVGERASVEPEPRDGREPAPATVTRVEDVEDGVRLVATFDHKADIPFGSDVRMRFREPVADREPFRSLPAGAPALGPKEARGVYACPDHPEALGLKSGACPLDGNTTERRDLAVNQRIRWWCPMHPKVTAEIAGATCAACIGMELAPRIVTYRPPGEVLTVPEAAVVDTGARRVVYVEAMPGVFDGVEVTLGPRVGGWYPVVAGLEPGRRVVAAGAFLIDAETRLNPALAASYFGAARTPTPARAAPEAPGNCPVRGKPLGSMGTPVTVEVRGASVRVCCAACVGPLQADPDRYLAKTSAHHP